MIQSINQPLQSTVHTPTLSNLFATIPREYVRVRYYNSYDSPFVEVIIPRWLYDERVRTGIEQLSEHLDLELILTDS